MSLYTKRLKRIMKIPSGIYRRRKLNNTDFSIVSNNCFGGAVYDYFRLPYLSPTVGLWIPPEDYLRFVKNLEYYLQLELVKIELEDCHAKELLLERYESGRYSSHPQNMILGRVGDVDIIFLHYKDFDDAKNKWDRRKKRVNYDNLIIKFNDQNGFCSSFFDEFDAIENEGARKLFITADEKYISKGSTEVVVMSQYKSLGYVGDDTNISELAINLVNYLRYGNV